MKKVVFIVEKDENGFSASAEDFDKHSIVTMGDDLPELRSNILDALNLQLEYNGKPLAAEGDIVLKYDMPSFFKFYDVINSKALAKRIGMSQSLLSQYTNGLKPVSEKQVQKVFEGIKRLGKELYELDYSFSSK
jgi:transcriptional regulator with XRE-family HTH domain